jgi:hypothetical protein
MSTAVAAIAAIVASACAFLSYRLSKGIYDEIKSDEVIVAGPLHHPGLSETSNDNCVLRCALFNKSKRKAYINSVKALNKNGKNIEITWSDSIDHIGNIRNPLGLLGIENSINLFIRRNDGKEFDETVIKIDHSFSSRALYITFDPIEGWQ